MCELKNLVINGYEATFAMDIRYECAEGDTVRRAALWMKDFFDRHGIDTGEGRITISDQQFRQKSLVGRIFVTERAPGSFEHIMGTHNAGDMEYGNPTESYVFMLSHFLDPTST